MVSRPDQGSSVRLGVIDDDSGFATVLVNRLAALGWEHRITAGPLPVDELVALRLHAVVLNPAVKGTGWDYLELVCTKLPGLAVVVCTGTTSVAQRVRGLRLGADDWRTKPCHPDELLARVEAAIRSRRRIDDWALGSALLAGELEIRPSQFCALVNGTSIDLTRREFELIELLIRSSGQVLPREDVYERVWGYAMAHGDRSVDVFVRKLRHKLDLASPGWQYIHTHFGVGYRFSAEPRTEDAAAQPAEPDPVESLA